jgi:acyl carrier protein
VTQIGSRHPDLVSAHRRQEVNMVTQEQIFTEIVRVLSNELLIDTDLRADTDLETLGLDSIQLMQLFVYMEDSFNFEFSPDETIGTVKNFSLGKLTEFIHASATRPVSA